MRKIIPNVLFSLIGLAAIGSASAADNRYMGTLCNPMNSAAASAVGYNQFGVHNAQNTLPITVECGAAPLSGANVTSMEARVADRNSAFGHNVCCTFMVQDQDGLIIHSSLQCTANGGSTSPQTLSAAFPANSAGTANVECSIPPTSSGNFSHVITYRVQSTP